MLEVKINVPEIKSFINEIVEAPGKIFNIGPLQCKRKCKRLFN